eukprot:8660843-Prorocentrum_lima.AAC.1
MRKEMSMRSGTGLRVRTMFPHPVGEVQAGEPTVGIYTDEDSWKQEGTQLFKEGTVIGFVRPLHGT